MRPFVPAPTLVVPSRSTALILTSPELNTMLLPEGLITSPYEILSCQHTLILHDPKGQKATFRGTQQLRFLQRGVAGLVDPFWGNGIALTSYRHDAGELADSFRDAGMRYVVIGFKRPMGRGEQLTTHVERVAMESFTEDQEWFTTAVNQPIQRLRSTIVFPKERPCQLAILDHGEQKIALPIIRRADGRTTVSFRTDQAQADTPYTIRWHW